MIVNCYARVTNTVLSVGDVKRLIGREFFSICYKEFSYALDFLGNTIEDFLASFDIFRDQLPRVSAFGQIETALCPSMRVDAEASKERLRVLYSGGYSELLRDGHVVAGVIEAAGRLIFRVELIVQLAAGGGDNGGGVLLYVTLDRRSSAHGALRRLIKQHPKAMSRDPRSLPVPVATFCETFPFHFVLNRAMTLVQVGVNLSRLLAATLAGDTAQKQGGTAVAFSRCFHIAEPIGAEGEAADFELIRSRQFAPYRIVLKDVKGRSAAANTANGPGDESDKENEDEAQVCFCCEEVL